MRAELLSPAGDPECFKAAVNAGADAVYMGLKRFGARSFAGNFTEEEFVEALDHAHLFDKKVYLTLNILMKDRELSDAARLLEPLYRAGLDGVIVQDTGLISLIKREYPDLSVHVSTQGFVTGVHGARLLRELGAERVVPARELSLEEIREIKEKAGVEVECFIHGALCYSYSGMCLMSSFLGGRSGNRGRCAGPCRQPYDNNDYILSMKDLCALREIPALLKAGVDSLKIEGRMKSKEYVYFVTSAYRKYMDLYYEKGDLNKGEKDIREILEQYSRSGAINGYFHKHNGGEMITRERGSYKAGEAVLPESGLSLEASVSAVFKKGRKARIILEYGSHRVECEGINVEEAENKPLSPERIEKQLRKTGNSGVSFKKTEIISEPDIFLPVSAINDLRRKGIEALKEDILNEYRRSL